jgi:hypothetical protein
MNIETYLADICFCRKCGQGLRENFEREERPGGWRIRCRRCSHEFTITDGVLDMYATQTPVGGFIDYRPWIGQRVRKPSKNPFKSGLKVNTVKGIIEHPQLPGKPAFTFEEDDSYVRCSACELETQCST